MWAVGAALLLGGLHTAASLDPPPTPEFPPCIRNPKEGELFSTDNFPAKYKGNLNCTYNLVAKPGKKVHLTFFVIDTETNTRCSYDYINILDSNGTQLHRFCGKSNANLEVTSSGENLTLVWRTDSVQEHSGFLASWKEVDEIPEKEEASPGQYMVTFPSAFLLSSPETVCVELFGENTGGELSVQVITEDKEKKGAEPWIFERSPILSESATISSEEAVACLQLTLPVTTKGDKALLHIQVTPQGSSPLASYREITLLKREDYPLVQTDKGQYKAKDTVKFRVLLLDHNLKPSPIESVEELWIEDPKSRRMEQWKNVSLNLGLLQKEHKLGEEPELGEWTVNFKAGSLKKSTEFTVSEYVLPKFEVEIQPPAAVLKDAEEAEWKICAKYTHGGAVKGTVKANFSSKYQSHQWRAPPPIIKNIAIDSTVNADMDCATLKLTKEQIKDLTEKVENFRLDTEYEEEGTATKVTSSWTGSVVDKAILMDIGDSSGEFILGGFPYTGELVVKNHDGSPVVAEEILVCVRLFRDLEDIKNLFNRRGIWGMDEDDIIEVGRKMVNLHYTSRCHSVMSDSAGKIKFNVPLYSIPEDVKKLSIKAKALNRPANETTGMKQPEVKLDVKLTPAASDLSLGLNRKERGEIQCNQDFQARIYFSSPDKRAVSLHYNAVSKGEIYKSGKLNVEIGKEDSLADLVEGTQRLDVQEDGKAPANPPLVSSKDITIPVSPKVSPSLKLVVFVNEGNQTLADSHTYTVEPCQNHAVETKWNKDKVYPGKDVTMTVTAQPGSLCALSATDKAVDLLGNNNKITGKKVAKLQETIGQRKTGQISFDWAMKRQCPEAYEALKVFEGTGMRIQTDLPIISSCQTVTDANNLYSLEPEVLHSPVAFSSPSARNEVMEDNEGMAYAESMVAPQGRSRMAPQSRGRMAYEKMPSKGRAIKAPSITLRTHFPETWLFNLEVVGGGGLQDRELKAPHTITTWTGEAVCVHGEEGLGVAKPASLLVTQDFFAELRLPYSVKRGESFPLNVTVFNYLDVELPMVVTVKNQVGELELAQAEHSICVGAKDNNLVTIPTQALKLGPVNVTVEARISNTVDNCKPVTEGEGFTDALVRPLRVKPEGVPVEKVESDFKCIEDGADKFVMGKLEIPADTVADSERAWVYVTGDIMAPALENVGNLVRLPTGCGEQNMVGLVPNIYLLQYLESTGQREAELEEKAKEYMRIGYRRQQNYNHPNGAYSIWGDKGDKDGSSWLTAFVVKSFSEAAQYIDVSSSLVQRSVDWLMSGQLENGCFPKRGYTHSSYLKGGGSDSSLTPFIVTALLEAASTPKLKIKMNIEKLGEAVNCMMKGLNTSDLYSSIATAHTVSLLDSKLKAPTPLGKLSLDPKQREEVDSLMTHLASVANTTVPGAEFWEEPRVARPGDRWRWGYYSSSKAVEMTAYMVLTRVLREEQAEALESVKWLAKQRNSRGGFVSTQDTVVALQALSLYSQRVTRVPLDMTVKVTEKHETVNELGVFNMNVDNGLLLQSQKLTKLPSKLELDTKGSGCALVQTVLRYNVPDVPQAAGFELTAQQGDGEVLNVCAKYTGDKETTGMVVLELEMVSGWEAVDPESLVNEVHYEIQRVERGKEDQETVVLYFDSWPKEERCVAVDLKQVVTITEAKPALVTIYDYYNTEDRASALYSLK